MQDPTLLVHVLAWAAAKSAGVLAAAGLVTVAMRRASAAARHLVWSLAVTVALLLPIASLLLPTWRVAVLPRPASVAIVATPTISPPERPRMSIRGSDVSVSRPTMAMPIDARAHVAPAPIVVPPTPRHIDTAMVVLVVWAAGFTIIALTWFVGIAAAHRLGRRTPVVVTGPLFDAVDAMRRELGIGRRVRLHVGGATPLTWGIAIPHLLLPASAAEWSPARLRAVLLHELSHVRRHDCATQLLAQLCCAVHWSNPLAWVAAGRMAAERERACDDATLRHGADPADYADLLVAIAAAVRGRSLLAALPMARRSGLRERVGKVLNRAVNRRPVRRRFATSAALGAAALLVAAAAVRFVPRAARAQVVPATQPTVVAPRSPSPPTAPSSAGEQPQLRLLAWQPADKPGADRQPAVWRADGQPASDADVAMARFVVPPVVHASDADTLQLWIAGAELDNRSVLSVDVTDDKGRSLLSPRNAVGASVQTHTGGDPVAVVSTCLSRDAHRPAVATVKLSYTGGAWTDGDPISTVTPGSVTESRPDGTTIYTADGQDKDGHAFCTLVQTGRAASTVQRSFSARTKDGRAVPCDRTSTAGAGDVTMMRFTADVPLADVVTFVPQTRPVRTVTFADVPLAPAPAAPATQPAASHLHVSVVDDESGLALANATVSTVTTRGSEELPRITGGAFDLSLPAGNATPWVEVTGRCAGHVPVEAVWHLPDGVTTGRPNLPESFVLRLPPRALVASGVVRDDAGLPIANAEVWLFAKTLPYPPQSHFTVPWLEGKVMTDKDGRWRCDEVPPTMDHLGILVGHEDYADTELRPTRAEALAGKAVTILTRGFDLTGTVRDANGPVAGARVRRGVNGNRSSNDTTKTDGAGRFAFHHLPAGDVTLVAQAAGHGPALNRAVVGPGKSAVVDLVMPVPGRTITGTVVDGAGAPVAGAEFSRPVWREVHTTEFSAKTDDAGRFTVRDAPAEPLAFEQVYKEGFGFRVDRTTLSPDAPDQRVTLSRQLHLHGRVTDADTGRPIPQFAVMDGTPYAERNLPPLFNAPTAIRSDDGAYALDCFYDHQRLVVRVEAEAYAPAESAALVPDRSDLACDVQLHRAPPMIGTARRPDGSPLAGGTVYVSEAGWLMSMDPRRIDGEKRVVTDDAGRFSVPPQIRDYTLAVADPAGFADVPMSVRDRAVTIDLQPWAVIHARVMDGGRPVANASVELRLDQVKGPGEAPARLDWCGPASTDSDGRFTWDRTPSLPPGRVGRLYVGPADENHAGYTVPIVATAGRPIEVTLGAGGRTLVGRVTLPPGFPTPVGSQLAEVRVTAVDTDAMPAGAGAGFKVDPAANPGGLPRRIYQRSLAADGSFAVDGLAPGDYVVNAELWTGRAGNSWMGSRTATIPADGVGPVAIGSIEVVKSQPLTVGQPVPPMRIARADGSMLDLAKDYAGRPVLVVFWSTCTPTLDPQAAHIAAVAKRYAGKVGVVGANLDQVSCNTIGVAGRSADRADIPWDSAFVTLSQQSLVAQYGASTASPEVILVGADGNLLARDLAGDEIERAVARCAGVR